MSLTVFWLRSVDHETTSKLCLSERRLFILLEPLVSLPTVGCQLGCSKAMHPQLSLSATATTAKPKAASSGSLGMCRWIFTKELELGFSQLTEPGSWMRVSWIPKIEISLFEKYRFCADLLSIGIDLWWRHSIKLWSLWVAAEVELLIVVPHQSGHLYTTVSHIYTTISHL